MPEGRIDWKKKVLVIAFEAAVMGSLALEITHFSDKAHGIDIVQYIRIVQHIRELARQMTGVEKEVLVTAFKAAVMGRD